MTARNVTLLWLCLVALALGRERLLGIGGLSSPVVAAWLGLLALPMVLAVAQPKRFRHPWLGVQRAISGALTFLGIYGGIKYLGAPLSVALGFLDTIILYYRDRRSNGRLAVSICIVGFIAQASWDLRFEPALLTTGFAWVVIGVVGRVWNYVTWQLQNERDESLFWVLFMPLAGSAIGGMIVGVRSMSFFPTVWWPVALIVAALGLAAFVVENRVVIEGGALNARLAEITALPAIWIGHWLLSSNKPRLIEGVFGFIAAVVATLAIMNSRQQKRALQ